MQTIFVFDDVKPLTHRPFAQYWFATETFTCSAQEGLLLQFKSRQFLFYWLQKVPGFVQILAPHFAAAGPARLNGWMVGKHLIWLIVLPCWALRQARVQKSNLKGWIFMRNKKVRFSPVERLKRSQGFAAYQNQMVDMNYEWVLDRELLSEIFSAFNRLCQFNTRREASFCSTRWASQRSHTKWKFIRRHGNVNCSTFPIHWIWMWAISISHQQGNHGNRDFNTYIYIDGYGKKCQKSMKKQMERQFTR